MDQLLAFALLPITWAFTTFARLLSESGFLPVFLAVFFVGTVLRLIVRPLVGDSAKGSRASKPKDNVMEG